MLTYRPIDYDKDIEKVVELIQNNLDSKFSVNLFEWKHLENPFGRSVGFVALEDADKLVGVRMMMRWNFLIDENIIKAVRPVDTATDLEFRGNGIFKKLTAECLRTVQDECDLVFNTPNRNSLPGNLKMGWTQLYDIPSFKLGIINPLYHSIKNFPVSKEEINLNNTEFLLPSTSYLNEDFIKWRYKSDDYTIVEFEIAGHYLIYKKSSISGIPMLIIYEMIGDEQNFSKMLNSLGKRLLVFLIYFYYKDFASMGMLKAFSRDRPVVVIKGAAQPIVKKLKFSLGDLESKI